jgi:alkylhydroperoxidase/carboxymuconolactone decarboxylase family protein YurZ
MQRALNKRERAERIDHGHPNPRTEKPDRLGALQAWVEAYASQFHISPEQVPTWFADTVGSRFGEEAIQSAANSWTDDELSLRDRSLIVIAALIAQGDLEAQLRMHTRWALDHGSTASELEALATLLAIYTGFARASHGLTIIRDELAKQAAT